MYIRGLLTTVDGYFFMHPPPPPPVVKVKVKLVDVSSISTDIFA